MPIEKIHMSDVVRVTLNHHGVKIIRAYYESECARRGVDSMLEDLAEQKAPYRVTLRTRLISMWELFKIFGPHFITGDRHPFDSIEFDRPPSETERRSNDLEKLLSDAAKAMGLGDTDYCAPEEVARRVHVAVSADPPSRTPDRPGQWWLDDRVVTVENDTSHGYHRLLVVLGNGRRKPTTDVEGWAGPALRDARIPDAPLHGYDKPDEDMPF